MTGMNKIALAFVALLYLIYVSIVFSCQDDFPREEESADQVCEDVGGDFVPDVGNPDVGMCVMD